MSRRAAPKIVANHPSQLALPLFADDAADPTPPQPSALPVEAPPAGPVDAAVALPQTEAQAPPAPIAPQHHAGDFRHPRAERDITLGGVRVGYELVRVRRRSIGMVVSPEGLTVRAPRWVGHGDIEVALRGKERWICDKLAEQRARARRNAASKIDWREGATLPFMGETVILVLDPRATGCQFHTGAEAPDGGQQETLAGVPRLTLHVGLPQHASEAQIRDAVQAWLMRQAKRVFEERCAIYAQQLGVQMKRLLLSSAQTRWGSASADGSIRLNWRLIHFALPTIDYVVAHELAHLRHMDHSPRFWDVVRSVIPHVDAAREQLRDPALPALE
jgi:predicted metal-dependent hydrolase